MTTTKSFFCRPLRIGYHTPPPPRPLGFTIFFFPTIISVRSVLGQWSIKFFFLVIKGFDSNCARVISLATPEDPENELEECEDINPSVRVQVVPYTVQHYPELH